jgi:tetratricopeptide (TPR) repeat protein
MNLGSALQAMGRLSEASASYRTAIALKPDLALAHYNLSTLLNAQGAYAEAVDSATRAIELMPTLIDAYVHVSVGLTGQRRFAEAECTLRRALALQPGRPETLSELGRVLTELTRYDEAVACHRRAIALRPDNAMMHYLLGSATVYAGDPHSGEAIFRHALALNPKLAIAWTGLGQVLRVLGQFEKAQVCFRRALELDSTLPYADTGLAFIGHQADDEAQLERLHAHLVRPDLPVGIRIDAGFALGKLLDNADRFDEAFPCFTTANALHRRQLIAAGQGFDLAALRQQVDGLIAQCTPGLYAAVEGSGNPSQMPVFIVGMPRSGTSLVEQIAASHTQVFGAGELRDVGSIADALEAHARDCVAQELDPDLAGRLAGAYVAKLLSLGAGKARVIDKLPDNILHLGMVGVLFPSARIIFCRRDPRDTILSCFFRKFDAEISWAYDLVDCGHRALEIERLAEHWRRVLPQRLLTIDYETLVGDLEGESRRLIEFLGLDWEPACLEFYKTDRPVLTASGWQVRQPLYTQSVGRWRHYERHLAPLLEILAAGSSVHEAAEA